MSHKAQKTLGCLNKRGKIMFIELQNMQCCKVQKEARIDERETGYCQKQPRSTGTENYVKKKPSPVYRAHFLRPSLPESLPTPY